MYCACRWPESGFDNEHVFSRSLCGAGQNWTLTNLVCKKCNNRFSKFESELLNQAAETLARAFSGPLGRSARQSQVLRRQPLKTNHLYILNKGDDLVYEGGFSFPAEGYFRPQIIDVGDGTMLSIISNREEIASFSQAVSSFVRQPIRITLPRPKGQLEYEVVSFTEVCGHWLPTSREMGSKPSNVFFREFIRRSTLPPMTSRLAQNDDGRLFLRAADLPAVGKFIELMFTNKNAEDRPELPREPGSQTFLFALQIDLIKIYKAVLKTGINLVAHLLGDETVRNTSFDQSRMIVLEDEPSNLASSLCRMITESAAEFPKASGKCHQLMLDQVGDLLRFRMRLYGSFGYEAILATVDYSLQSLFAKHLPKKVLVEYETVGIREVQDWP